MEFTYYYNNVPNEGLVRNNLIYTSLISKDKKTFVQWYYNDTEYHKGKNQIIDPSLMDEKWHREVKFLKLMQESYPDHIPEIIDIDDLNRKIYLKIDGVDMWEQAGCEGTDYSKVLPDWDQQMLEILKAHKDLNFYKYSLHPSSYFIVDGKMKSINYFFCHTDEDEQQPISHFQSHISSNRQDKLKAQLESAGIGWNTVLPYKTLQVMAFENFKSNYRSDFIEDAKRLYVP